MADWCCDGALVRFKSVPSQHGDAMLCRITDSELRRTQKNHQVQLLRERPMEGLNQDTDVNSTMLRPSELIGNGLQVSHREPQSRGSAMGPGRPAALWAVAAEHGPHGTGQGSAARARPFPQPGTGQQGHWGSPSLTSLGTGTDQTPRQSCHPVCGACFAAPTAGQAEV